MCTVSSAITVVDTLISGSGNGCFVGQTPEQTAPDFSILKPCTAALFSQACKTLIGSLQLYFYPVDSRNVGPVRMGQYLTLLGLNGLSYISGNFRITVLASNFVGQVPATPFLPVLLAVNGTLSVEDRSVKGVQLFASLPLQSVQWVSELTLFTTGLTNLTSFSGLLCVKKNLQIFSNSKLRSLAGLNSLQVANYQSRDYQGLVIMGNDVLVTPAGFQPLARAAGCLSLGYGPPLYTASTITVIPGECDLLSYAALCDFIATGTCVR